MKGGAKHMQKAFSGPARTAITLSIVAVAYMPYEWERWVATGKSRCSHAMSGRGAAARASRLAVLTARTRFFSQPCVVQDSLCGSVPEMGVLSSSR